MGGAVYIDFNDPKSELMISSSYFKNISADMGACIVTNNPTGIVYVENNIFIENRGVTEWKVLIGSGSVLRSGEARNTIIKYSHNLAAFNEVENKGFIIFFFP